MSVTLETEVLYRLSLLIEDSQGMDAMLRSISNEALGRLGGVAAVILECPRPTRPPDPGDRVLEVCFSIPQRFSETSEFLSFQERWRPAQDRCPPPELKGWQVLRVDDSSFVVLNLPDFGYWVLVFRSGAPREPFLHEISTLAARLASACRGLRLREELQRSRVKAELALSHGDMGIWEWDVRSDRLLWDERIREFHGIGPEVPVSVPLWLSLLRPEERRAAHEGLLAAQRGRLNFEASLNRGDGQTRHLEGWGGPVHGEDGEVVAVIGVGLDVTERKRKEEALRIAAALERAFTRVAIRLLREAGQTNDTDIDEALAEVGLALNLDRVYVFRHDLDARVTHNTHEWCAPGIEPQIEYLQNQPFDMFPDWLEAHQAGRSVLIPDVSQMQTDAPLREVLEAQQIRSLLAIPMMHDGELRGFVGFDAVRAQKNWTDSEEVLLRVLAELLVNAEVRRERDLQLQDAQSTSRLLAEEAQRRANEAVAALEAKSHFIAVLSHEIRTPLTGVLGMTELLQESPLGEAQSRYVAGLRKSSALLKTTIDRILDLAKLEAGKLELEVGPFSPAKVITDALSMFEGAGLDKGLSLRFDLSPNLPAYLLGDDFRLQQIMGNLLSNAIKFTDHGSVTAFAHFMADAGSPDRGTLLVGTEDTGIGFDSEKAHHITEAFEQESRATVRRFGGSGLGLSIVRELARLMGGELHLSSLPGLGSKIWIALPVSPAQGSPIPVIGPRELRAVAVGRKTQAFDTREEGPSGLEGLRVLVVDDHEGSRVLLLEQLSILGAVGVPAADASEALRALEEETFDLLVIDYHMPKMDGLQTISELFGPGWDGPPPPPVLGTTADVSTEGVRERFLETGASGFLFKPYSLRELHSTLLACLHPRAAGEGE